MKTYYIQQDNQPKGPYSIDQLKKMQINPGVPVRAEGFKNWIKAKEIPELYKALFAGIQNVIADHTETTKESFQPGSEKTGSLARRTGKQHWYSNIVYNRFLNHQIATIGKLCIDIRVGSVSAIEKKNQPAKTRCN